MQDSLDVRHRQRLGARADGGYEVMGKEKHLHLRGFSDAQKLKMFERQGGVCPL